MTNTKEKLVANAIVKSINESITHHHATRFFDIWLDMDNGFGYIYVKEFKEQYSEFMTEEIESKLHSVSQNLVYLIKAYTTLNESYDIAYLRNLVEHFIDNQIEDIDNWCDELYDCSREEGAEENTECHNFSFCHTTHEKWVIEQYGGTCFDCWSYFGHINITGENKECDICNETKDIIKIACNHEMCYDCWKKIADNHENLPTKCPFCRAQIGAWKLQIG